MYHWSVFFCSSPSMDCYFSVSSAITHSPFQRKQNIPIPLHRRTSNIPLTYSPESDSFKLQNTIRVPLFSSRSAHENLTWDGHAGYKFVLVMLHLSVFSIFLRDSSSRKVSNSEMASVCHLQTSRGSPSFPNFPAPPPPQTKLGKQENNNLFSICVFHIIITHTRKRPFN